MNKSSPLLNQPSVNEVVNWLIENKLPPLPIAPAQDAYKYPKLNPDNPEKGIYCHAPLAEVDGKLCPVPRFTGKNPSYLDNNDHPHSVNHRIFQSRMPDQGEINSWFSNPKNGIATLGNEHTVFVDFDVKNFGSTEACDAAVGSWVEANPKLQNTYAERTHSGGWHFMVQTEQPKAFTNFALEPGGPHVGEVLGVGRVCVLAPTIGPTGNSYQVRQAAANPVLVADLSTIGVYKSGAAAVTKASQHGVSLAAGPIKARPRCRKTVVDSRTVDLSDLISDRARDVLVGGGGGHSDRSYAILSLARESFGWENWARDNSIALAGQSAKDLTLAGGVAHGADEDHVQRIMDGASLDLAHPSCEHGGEHFPWLRLRKISPILFEEKAPNTIKTAADARKPRLNLGKIVDDSVDLNHQFLTAASLVLKNKGQVGSDDYTLSFAGSRYNVNLDKKGKISVLKDGLTIFAYQDKKTIFNRTKKEDSKSLLIDAEIESNSTTKDIPVAKQYSPKATELLNLASLIMSRAGQPSESGGFKVQGKRNLVTLSEDGTLLAKQEGKTVLIAKGSDIEFSLPSDNVLKDFRRAASFLCNQKQPEQMQV